jgi:multidrug resistance protein, MATE family
MTTATPAAGTPAQDVVKVGLLKRLLLLAGPVAGSNVLVMLMGLVDSIIVGRNSAVELAELALAWTLNGTAMVGMMGLLVGVQVLSARRFGEGRPEAIGVIWRRGVVWAVLVGGGLGLVLQFGGLWAMEHLGQKAELAKGAASCAGILGLSLIPIGLYLTCSKVLEALSRPKVALILMAVANVVNLGLNLWLVPSLGADGAAWSTFGARTFLAICGLSWLLLMPGSAAYKFLDFSTTSQEGEAKEQLSIGLSASGSGILEAGSFNVLTLIAGLAGIFQVGAFNIVMNMMSIGFMPAMGLASATAVVASNLRGEGDAKGAVRVAWIGLAVSAVYAALFAIGTVIFAAPLAGIFTKDATLIAYGTVLVGLVWLMAVPDFMQVVAAQSLRALGRPWFPTVSHFVSYVLVMSPLGWLLCIHFDRGARGLVEAVAIASIVSAGVLMGRLMFIGKVETTPAPSEDAAAT